MFDPAFDHPYILGASDLDGIFGTLLEKAFIDTTWNLMSIIETETRSRVVSPSGVRWLRAR